jgi:hypothetical protein
MLTEFVLALTLSAAPAGDVEKLGKTVAADFAAGRDGLSPVLDIDALMARTFEGVNAPDQFRQGFVKGFKRSGGSVGKVLAQQMREGARMTFRKVVALDGESAAQLRVLWPNGGFNVFELMVKPGADGRLKVVDMYDLLAGELKSTEIRRWVLTLLAETDRNLVDRLMGRDRLFYRHLPKLKAMFAAAREGRAADAVEEFKSLPREVQDQRSVLRFYAAVSADLDEDEYEQALRRYLRMYPDASSHAVALDFYFLKQDWAKLDRSIDIIERRVGADDAWFEVLRANSQMARGNPAAAKRHLARAVGREKTLDESYFLLVGISLEEKNYADTVRWLEALERDAGVPLADVSSVPEYAEFAASKEGKAFIEKQRAAEGRQAR